MDIASLLPEELDDLFPSSDDESRSDEEFTHILRKARKYGDNNFCGRRRRGNSNRQKRKTKYEQYVHAAGALLVKKAGGDVGEVLGGRFGANCGRLAGVYAANPNRFGDRPERLVNSACGRRRRRPGRRRRRRGGRRRGRGGQGGGGQGGGCCGGGGQGGGGGGGGGGGRRSDSDDDDGNCTDSSGTSSDWGDWF